MIATGAGFASGQSPHVTGIDIARPLTGITAGGTAALQPVAARSIPRGAMLTMEDIAYAPAASPAARRSPSAAAASAAMIPAGATDSLIGRTTRRVIGAGEPLRAPAVAAPDLVKAGQEVDVVWQRGSVTLVVRGTATRAGRESDRITVRFGARQTIEGIVTGAGSVRAGAK